MPKGEGKELKGRLAVELLSLDTVDMREDYVSSVLRKSVKTASLGQDVAKERMVFLNTRLLVSLVGVTEEKRGLLGFVQSCFKGEDIREFTAVICQHDREQRSKA